jgi:hypothetical protein
MSEYEKFDNNSLNQFEVLVNQAYKSLNNNDRLNAEKRLKYFESVQAISQLQDVLTKSNDTNTLFFTSKTLLTIYTDNWASLSKNQKNDMSNFFF